MVEDDLQAEDLACKTKAHHQGNDKCVRLPYFKYISEAPKIIFSEWGRDK